MLSNEFTKQNSVTGCLFLKNVLCGESDLACETRKCLNPRFFHWLSDVSLASSLYFFGILLHFLGRVLLEQIPVNLGGDVWRRINFTQPFLK